MTDEYTDIDKLARLARLALNEEEKRRLPNEMARILQLVAELKKVDVTGIKPMCHAGDRSLWLREDQPHEVLGRQCLSQSQGYEEGLVRVPKIIE